MELIDFGQREEVHSAARQSISLDLPESMRKLLFQNFGDNLQPIFSPEYRKRFGRPSLSKDDGCDSSEFDSCDSEPTGFHSVLSKSLSKAKQSNLADRPMEALIYAQEGLSYAVDKPIFVAQLRFEEAKAYQKMGKSLQALNSVIAAMSNIESEKSSTVCDSIQ